MHKNRNRRVHLVAAAIIISLLAGIFVVMRDGVRNGARTSTSGATAAASTASAAAAGPAASVAAVANPWQLAAHATAAADRSDAEVARERAYLLDPRNDAEWCRRGVPQSVGAFGSWEAAPDRIPRPRGAGTEALEEARRAVLTRWAAALTASGDDASLATRDYLLARIDPARFLFEAEDGRPTEEGERAAVRLAALARRSSDPYVSALAVHLGCERSACNPALLARWLQLEPEGLRVNLWRLQMPGAKLADADDALQRIARGAPGLDHEARYMERLLALPRSPMPGLQQAAEGSALTLAFFAAPQPPAVAFAQHCTGAAGAARAICNAVAERLYAAERSVLGRMAAIAAADALDAPADAWRARRDETFAIHRALKDDDQFMELAREVDIGRCETLPARLAALGEMTRIGEHGAMLRKLREAGTDIANYAAPAVADAQEQRRR